MPYKRTPTLVTIGIGWVAATLLFCMGSAGRAAVVQEGVGMPAELEARQPVSAGERFDERQVIVKSLKTHEDRLYVNNEPFVITHQTSIVDERGRRLRPGSMWVGWLVELQYRTGERSEGCGHGPDEKVLVRMRVLKRLQESQDQSE